MEMVHFIPPSQRRLAMLASQTDTAPVLIYGASGTGKGAIARWIHGNGPRATLPLVTSEKGKALSTQIPLAQGGTLVIHEIGSLPLGEQKTLLAFLNTRSLTMPNGVSMLLNVRIMVTTSQTLEGRAQCGLFNPELLKKLNVFRLEMPSLARRNEEFDDIVLGIIGEITRELHKEHLRSLSPGAWERLRNYDWPGNLRELRNVLRMAVVAAKGDWIEETDLPAFGHDRIDFRATREEFEKIYILELLKTFDWQIDRLCALTRMDKKTLLSKIHQYGIRLPQPTSELPVQ
jgi:DNA-binding NtrC family response regulator